MTEEKLLAIIPEFLLIEDPELRQKCMDVWLDVLSAGGWEHKGAENCGLAPGHIRQECPENNVLHTRHVVQMCAKAADVLEAPLCEQGAFSRDILLAGALLHDIGKFLEYDFVDGQMCISKQGRLFAHTVSGAHYAKKHALPEAVVYLVLAHSDNQSPGGRNVTLTPELAILKTADAMCYDVFKIYYGM